MKRIRQLCVVLLSLALVCPVLATAMYGTAQMTCQHMKAMSHVAEKAAMKGVSDQADMAKEKQKTSAGHCVMEQSCALCYVSVVGTEAGMVPPLLYGGQQLTPFPQSLNPSAMPDGVWHPPRTL